MTYPATQAREPVRPDIAGTMPPAGDLRALLNAPGSRTVLLDASRDPNSCVTVLVLAPGAPQPHLAVKVATTPAAAGVIEREADFLVRVGRRRCPGPGRPCPGTQVPSMRTGCWPSPPRWCPACPCVRATTPSGIWETPPRCAPTSRPPGTGSPPCMTTA